MNNVEQKTVCRAGYLLGYRLPVGEGWGMRPSRLPIADADWQLMAARQRLRRFESAIGNRKSAMSLAKPQNKTVQTVNFIDNRRSLC
jgi:hypothetical protein